MKRKATAANLFRLKKKRQLSQGASKLLEAKIITFFKLRSKRQIFKVSFAPLMLSSERSFWKLPNASLLLSTFPSSQSGLPANEVLCSCEIFWLKLKISWVAHSKEIRALNNTWEVQGMCSDNLGNALTRRNFFSCTELIQFSKNFRLSSSMKYLVYKLNRATVKAFSPDRYLWKFRRKIGSFRRLRRKLLCWRHK